MCIFGRMINKIVEIGKVVEIKLRGGVVGKNCRIHKGFKLSFEQNPKDKSVNGSVKIGNDFFARDFLYIDIVAPGKLTIGDGVFISNFCSITSLESITIGNNTLLGENVRVYDHNHNFKEISKIIKAQGFNTAPVIIGSNCWIASNVTILKGVTIGDNSIIGAGCVVYKNVPSDSIMFSDGSIKHKENNYKTL